MKIKHVLMPLLAVVILATCASGCLSTNPTSNQNSNNAAGVPVFQPSVRTAAVNTSEGRITTYQTTGSAAQVTDFYKTEMAKRGYHVSASYQASPSSAGSDTVLSCVKGTSTVRIAIATINAEIGPLNLTKVGATTFVITQNAGTSWDVGTFEHVTAPIYDGSNLGSGAISQRQTSVCILAETRRRWLPRVVVYSSAFITLVTVRLLRWMPYWYEAQRHDIFRQLQEAPNAPHPVFKWMHANPYGAKTLRGGS